jgi:hypothetical protein
MRFAHVDGEEVGVLFIVFVNLRDVANLAAKRRSGKTAEDEDERLPAGAFTNVKTLGAIQGHQARVGGVVSHFQFAAVHVREGVAHHTVGVAGTSGHEGQAYKCTNHQHQHDADDPFPEQGQEIFSRSILPRRLRR